MTMRGLRFGRRKERLVEVLARELATAQAESWESIGFHAFVVDGRTQSRTTLLGPGFPPPRAQEPTTQAFWEALADLRGATAAPGTGAWFTITISVPSQGSPGVTFDYDREPGFVPPPRPADYARDVALYPRDVVAQPPWLRERLSWAVLTPDQERLAQIGRAALEGPPMMGGTRYLFPVSVHGDLVAVDDQSGRRVVVSPDGTFRFDHVLPPASGP